MQTNTLVLLIVGLFAVLCKGSSVQAQTGPGGIGNDGCEVTAGS